MDYSVRRWLRHWINLHNIRIVFIKLIYLNRVRLYSSLFTIDVIGGFADEFSLVVISNVFDNKFLSVSPYQHFLGGIHLKPCVLRWRVTFGFACQHCFVVELCSYNFGGANRQYTRWVYKGNKKNNKNTSFIFQTMSNIYSTFYSKSFIITLNKSISKMYYVQL